MTLHFKQATLAHKDTIFSWLAEPHMIEFWDNSQEHKDDILNFMHGRVKPSAYFGGTAIYWVGFAGKEPFCFLLTSEAVSGPKDPEIWNNHLSKTGKTYCIDFGIGNTTFLGKGLAALTLSTFCDFFRLSVEPSVGTFFMDPDINNQRAIHVYEKAGFKYVGNFDMDQGVFKGNTSYLMVKTYFSRNPKTQ